MVSGPNSTWNERSEVRFSRDSGNLSVGGDRVNTLWIDDIRKEIGAKVATLMPKTFSAAAFLERLARAYDSVASEDATQGSDSACLQAISSLRISPADSGGMPERGGSRNSRLSSSGLA